MGKADRYIEKYKYQNTQLNPFKNRKKYDFIEMMEHSQNQIRFINKIINKKLKQKGDKKMNNLKCLKNELSEINIENEKFADTIILKYQDKIINMLEEKIKKAMVNKEFCVDFEINNNINDCLIKEFGNDYEEILKNKIKLLDSPKTFMFDHFNFKISKILNDKGFYIFKSISNEDENIILWSKTRYIIFKLFDYIMWFYKK